MSTRAPLGPEARLQIQTSVTRILLQARGVDEAGARLLPVLGRALGWREAELWLVSETENVLRASAAWSEGGPALGAFTSVRCGAAVSPGHGLLGRVWSTGRSAFTSRLDGDLSRGVAEAAAAGLAGALALPVFVAGEVVGVMAGFGGSPSEPDEALHATLLDVGYQLGLFLVHSRTEAALRASEDALSMERHFLRALLDTLAEGIAACDRDGALTVVNRSMRDLLGIAGEEASAWPERLGLFSADGKEALPPDEEPLSRALRGELVRDVELVLRTGGGKPRAVVSSARPILDGAGRNLGAVVALHDVTERRTLEEQFRQAQKMEALGRLAGGVAHDFNNVLTTILGYSELLLERRKLGRAEREAVREVQKAGERGAELTRQLLAFSRKQVVESRVLDLNALIGDVEKMLLRVIGEDVSLRCVLAPDLSPVKADPGLLAQVLLNLAVNARDAMPHGGSIVLETANAVLDAAYAATHPQVRPGPYAMLAVSDTGEGIEPSILPRVFEPFFTTKDVGKGTGLGLSMVYGVVAQSGGHVAVYSEVNRGTTMRVYLPRAVEGPSVEDVPFVRRLPSGSERILVVEDLQDVRVLAGRVLREVGYQVLEAASGEAALRLFDEAAGLVDLLLTDTVMPGVSGPKLAEALRARQPLLRVLFMSGYTDAVAQSSGSLLQGSAFLQKPFTASALAQRVREVLDSGR